MIPYKDNPLEARRKLFERFVDEYRTRGGELPDLSKFDLMARTYEKSDDARQVGFLRFLLSHRARFVPSDQPRVTLPNEFFS